MSQAKVDKYKEEKKNRSKIMKRNKIKKVLLVLVAALGLGAIIGIPLGKFIYNKQKEIEAKNRTIATAEYITGLRRSGQANMQKPSSLQPRIRSMSLILLLMQLNHSQMKRMMMQ